MNGKLSSILIAESNELAGLHRPGTNQGGIVAKRFDSQRGRL
jgi:hypothetical protein